MSQETYFKNTCCTGKYIVVIGSYHKLGIQKKIDKYVSLNYFYAKNVLGITKVIPKMYLNQTIGILSYFGKL